MILASIHGGMGRAARLPAVVLGLLAAGCAGSGRTVELFNGSDLGGWECRESQTSDNAWQTASSVAADPADPTRLTIVPGAGILVNGPAGRACDLHTIQTFGDCELHVEFLVPRGSNSGVYLMGEYEIQILDSWGKADPGFGDCGGVYARWIDEQNVDGHPPRVNAARPPGEWQSFDIVFPGAALRRGRPQDRQRPLRAGAAQRNPGAPRRRAQGSHPLVADRAGASARSADAAGRSRSGGFPQHPHPPAGREGLTRPAAPGDAASDG